MDNEERQDHGGEVNVLILGKMWMMLFKERQVRVLEMVPLAGRAQAVMTVWKRERKQVKKKDVQRQEG